MTDRALMIVVSGKMVGIRGLVKIILMTLKTRDEGQLIISVDVAVLALKRRMRAAHLKWQT
jgi:hypothetical protein